MIPWSQWTALKNLGFCFVGKMANKGVQNTCAHRACPLHLGSVNEGRIRCPYHGWEYSIDGNCEKMPSTKKLNVKIRALPCLEQDGIIWIWLGDDPPAANLPSLLPPSGFSNTCRDCDGTSGGTSATSGQPFGPCTCSFHPHFYIC